MRLPCALGVALLGKEQGVRVIELVLAVVLGVHLLAVGVAMVALGERPEWSALAALGLVLSGIAVSENALRLRRPRP